MSPQKGGLENKYSICAALNFDIIHRFFTGALCNARWSVFSNPPSFPPPAAPPPQDRALPLLTTEVLSDRIVPCKKK